MKKALLTLCTLLLFSGFSVYAQKSKKISSSVDKVSAAELNSNPFAKGKWQTYLTTTNLAYSRKNIDFNGNDQGWQSNFNLNVGTHYFLGKGFGVGLELRGNVNTYNNINRQTNSSFMGYANVMYGNRISNDIFYYVRGGAGIGRNTFKYKTPTMTDKNSYSAYGFKAEAGLPIRLGHNSPAFFTPEISYGYTRTKGDNFTETDNHFGLGLRLESYLFCKQMSCACVNGHSLAEHMYDGGRSYLGISTKGGIRFGNIKTVYDNNSPDYKENYSNIRLSGEYMYYVTKNFSVGAALSYSSSVEKEKVSDYKYTSIQYGIAPMLEMNLPFKNPSLNSFFVRGGIEFGGEKYETDFPGPAPTSTDKNTVIAPCVGLGYNLFYSEKLALTLMYEYEWETFKDKDSDNKRKENGSAFVVGIRKFF